MEELLVFAVLLYEKLVTKDEYNKRLDELFLDHPENDDLLYLEWETDTKNIITYIRTHIDYNTFDYEQFGKILMNKLKVCYKNCSDIRCFADQMYGLWEYKTENLSLRYVMLMTLYHGGMSSRPEGSMRIFLAILRINVIQSIPVF